MKAKNLWKRGLVTVTLIGAISLNGIYVSAAELNEKYIWSGIALSNGFSVIDQLLEKLKGGNDMKSTEEVMPLQPGDEGPSSAPGETGPTEEKNAEPGPVGPESDMPYPTEDAAPADGPGMIQSYETVSGIAGIHASDILENLEQYGFSKEEGLTAPDGTTIWRIQKDNYACDILEDTEGYIYNSYFTTTADDYADYFTSCAEGFGEEVLAWVKENVGTYNSVDLDEAAVSISEGPGGYTMQICSKQYKGYLGAPE